MKFLGRILGFGSGLMPLFLLFGATSAHAGDKPYDFDLDSKNDMRGAWFMCSLKGFPGKECRDVFIKCNKPPLIEVKCGKKGCKNVTTCTKPPNFRTSQEDTDQATEYARAHPELGGDPGQLPDPMPDPNPDPEPEPNPNL